MNMRQVEPTELKQIIHELLGEISSNALLDNLYATLDASKSDPASLRESCVKIEKIVSLFMGPDTAKVLQKRFRDTLN